MGGGLCDDTLYCAYSRRKDLGLGLRFNKVDTG